MYWLFCITVLLVSLISVLGQAPPDTCTTKKDCPRAHCCVSAAPSREKRQSEGTTVAPTGTCKPLKKGKEACQAMNRSEHRQFMRLFRTGLVADCPCLRRFKCTTNEEDSEASTGTCESRARGRKRGKGKCRGRCGNRNRNKNKGKQGNQGRNRMRARGKATRS